MTPLIRYNTLSCSGSGSELGKESSSPLSANKNKTPLEIEEMEERTISEQKEIVSQKWEEINGCWAEDKSAKPFLVPGLA